MKRFVFALFVFAFSCRAEPTPTLSPKPATIPEKSEVLNNAEVARIQKHLVTVEQELLRRDVSSLTEEQQRARSIHIERLRQYRTAGVFPHNHGLSYFAPYFRDPHGTLCAVAYLMEQSGEGALVNEIARTRNNAYVYELASNPSVVSWLDANGLSAEEAGRIQPQYGPCRSLSGDDYCITADPTYTLAAMSIGMLETTFLALNLSGYKNKSNARLGGALGILSGSLGASMFLLRDPTSIVENQLAGLSLTAGIASGLVGAVVFGRSFTPEASSKKKISLLPSVSSTNAALSLRLSF